MASVVNKNLPSVFSLQHLSDPLFTCKKIPFYSKKQFAYNKKVDYNGCVMGIRTDHQSMNQPHTAMTTTCSFTNLIPSPSDNGIGEPLTIVTVDGVSTTSTTVRPAMALPQLRVPCAGNQDGRCTEPAAPVPSITSADDTGRDVQTQPLRGHLPTPQQHTVWGDGRAASSRMGDDTLHCGTRRVTLGETREHHRWSAKRRTVDENEDGWCGTTPHLTSSVVRGKPSLERHAYQDRTAASQPRDVAPSARPIDHTASGHRCGYSQSSHRR